MKRLFGFILAYILWSTSVFAQFSTNVYIRNASSRTVAKSVEKTISSLITEINEAYYQKRNPNLKKFNMSHEMKEDILDMWNNSKFYCSEPDVVEDEIFFKSVGYEIRNIPFIFVDLEKNDQKHQVSIQYDKTGMLQAIQLSSGFEEWKRLTNYGSDNLIDFERRQKILDYVDRFRTAYEIKDLHFIKQVFSDDALILIGKVIKSQHNDLQLKDEKVKIIRKSKNDYLKDLSHVFKTNSRITVRFDSIEIVRHYNPRADYKNMYLVHLKQHWRANYSDDGYVTLVWDFNNEEHPIIHVRSWLPRKEDDIDWEDLPF